MPRVATYENSVPLAQAPEARFRVADNAGGVGGAIAQGLQELGGQVSNLAQLNAQIDTQRAETEAKDGDNALVSSAGGLLDDPNTGLLSLSGRSAVEAYKPAVDALQARVREIKSGLSTPMARDMFERAADARLAGYQSVMARHVAVQQRQWDNDTSQSRIDLNSSDAVNAYGDEEAANKSIGAVVGEVHQMGERDGWSDETITDKTLKVVSGTRLAIGGRLATDSPDAADSYLSRYRQDFTGSDAAALENTIRVRRVAQQAQAEHQQRLVKEAVQQQIQHLHDRISAGEDVPDADLQTGEQLAQSIGDVNEAYKIGVVRVQTGVNAETKSWTPDQYDTEINRLQALGEKRTADQSVRLKQLEAIAPARKQQFDDNPAGWASLNGQPPPKLDLANPASVQARLGWASMVGRATGRNVAPLLPAEVSQYAAQAASPKGRVAVADQLAMFGGSAAVAAAKQVAPNDAMLGRLVLLRRGDRGAVVNGIDARKAYPELVDGKAGKDAQEAFQERLGGATALMGQGDVAAAFEIARSLYADQAVKDGSREFDPARFAPYIHRALGGTKDQQGQWHGGIGSWNGQAVLLPAWMSQSQFDTVLSRVNWPQGSGPTFRNGEPMRPADLRRLVPVQRPDGFYQFRDARGHVATTKNNDVWSLDLSSIGRKYLR